MENNNKTKCTLEDVLKAIDGSSGIKTVIGKRLGVCRQTVTSYIERWSTARQKYNQELESVLDMAESVVIRNIKLALDKQQSDREIVNSIDAKWVLSMKGRERGYAVTERHELTGKDGKDLPIPVIYIPQSDGIDE